MKTLNPYYKNPSTSLAQVAYTGLYRDLDFTQDGDIPLTVPYHTHPDATTSESGFLNPTDKVKLNNLDEDLSLATNDKLGRVYLTTTIDSNNLSSNSVCSTNGVYQYIQSTLTSLMEGEY